MQIDEFNTIINSGPIVLVFVGIVALVVIVTLIVLIIKNIKLKKASKPEEVKVET